MPNIRFRNIGPIYLGVFILVASLSVSHFAIAQRGEVGAQSRAEQLMREKKFDKALPIWQGIFEQAPFDKSGYSGYLDALIQMKYYEKADSVVQYMMKIRRGDPVLYIDLGRVALAAGKKRRANRCFDTALTHLPRNDFQVKELAESFEDAGQINYAVKTYLKARELSHNPYAYATELALLYNKEGDYKSAIDASLDKAMINVNITDDLHDALLQIVAKEKNGLKEIQKALNNRLKQNPDNPIWQELLSWIYTQSGDYKGALNNLIQLDKTFKEKGKRVIPFAKNATETGEYQIAEKGYDYVLEQGKESPYYQMASAGLLVCKLKQLEAKFPPEKAEVIQLLSNFMNFFTEFPHYKNSDLWRKYAMVEARYNDQPDTAVALLKQVVNIGRSDDNFIGLCKLDMGDYYILAGQIWNATLMYSQVNKAFGQDQLGEEARFKNAKWAFYKGDFSLAQEQLSVLKASTSKLIANDALYLSIMITENTPPDSNMLPLNRFAAADLLLFKHEITQADQLLDSIAKAWPKSPLQDDIAMLRGKTAEAAGEWQKAVVYYKKVLDDYGQDVLGDDAAWQLAELYRKQLKSNQEAIKYYKTIIVDYPGSTFAQGARKWYHELSSKANSKDI